MRATPERLFRAWTEPDELARWWRMEGDGWTFAAAEVDLRVGGAYTLAMRAPDGRMHRASGVYREIQRPSRIVFSWDWEDPASRVGDTLVTVEIQDLGDGTTQVTVVHERFSDPSHIPGPERGWCELLHVLDNTNRERS
jgi:uncharacterized protein YndB with AHSA1/START domain